MTLNHVWGALLILTLCPLLGGLPLIDWIVRSLTRQKLSTLGTGNISVSAAFYHGGKLAGILAVLSEASKGILSVLLVLGFGTFGIGFKVGIGFCMQNSVLAVGSDHDFVRILL